MDKELAFYGSKSGRDADKFKECNLETANSHRVASSITGTLGRHYECKINYRSVMGPAHFDTGYDSSLYPKQDYHTRYFGETLACYETE
jgi:hypothetical protein